MVSDQLLKASKQAGLTIAIEKKRNLSEFWSEDWLSQRSILRIYRADRVLLETDGTQEQIDIVLTALEIGLTYR